MKILIVSHEYPPVGGGGANACMNLAREYGDAGHDVTIVTVWFPGEEKITKSEKITIYRVNAKRKHMEHCGFSEMFDFLLKAKSLVDELEKDSCFDICQIFFGIPSGPIGYYLKKKYKVPYVIRFGGGDIPGFQDRFAFVYKAIAPFVKMIWKNADALVANSIGLRKLAIDFYDKKEIKIIPNGADLRAFKDDQSDSDNSYTATEDLNKEIESVSKSVVRLLFVSRLIERKGLQDILPQLAEINEKCKDTGITVKLDVIGDGPFRERLQSIAESEEITDIVCFHGQKAKNELPLYYSQADIFIFPSRKEGMPNAVLEAMSYGLPIIMTPCQGSDELIDGNGYVCSAEYFSEKIIELCSDAITRKTFGNKSLELIKNRYSWKNTADKYMELFCEITKKTDGI